MSQYINSFLIEPVVRQARRFSRPNNEPYLVVRREGEEDDASHYADALATAATAVQEEEPTLTLDINNEGISSTISGDTEVAESPTSINDADQGGSQSWQDEHSESTPVQIAVADSLSPTILARRHAFQEGGDTSVNPLYGAETFRSRASSLSSSRSLIDAHMSPADGTVQSPRLDGIEQRTRVNSGASRLLGDSALPADDGMGPIRRRIIAIQRTDISNEVKARLVHDLMVEKHNTSQQSLNGAHMARAHSPISTQSSERPFTPSSPGSMESQRQTVSPPASYGSGNYAVKPHQLKPEDLKPTYYEKPMPIRKDGDEERRSSETDEEPRALGCTHYKRNIKLQCSACNRWYTCRFCHDAVEDHMLNRKETKNMLCMLCGCAQPASEECALCSERGAWYYCDVCKLWDDDPHKSIYHCNDCGICRVGQGLGKDFFHCKTCCVCMSISIRDTHHCIERSTDCDCPICGDYMFTSPQTVVFMRCGHSIHHHCYNEHMKSSYRCPICSRSIVNMEMQFSRLESAIDAQPMPEEFRDTKAWVYCNDCSAKTSVRYHWLGLKCAVCDSYNTAQLQILSGPDPTGADNADAPPTAGGTPSSAAMTQTTPLSRPHSPNNRGRPRHHHHHQPTQSRSGNSAPPSAAAAAPLPVNHHPPPVSRTHSATPGNATATSFPFSPSPGPYDSDSGSSDADDSMEEYDEVDFWGGESPSSARLSRSPLARGNGAGGEGVEMVVDGEESEDGESEDGEDSEDEVMGDEEDEEDEDEGGGPMEMELIGHR